MSEDDKYKTYSLFGWYLVQAWVVKGPNDIIS